MDSTAPLLKLLVEIMCNQTDTKKKVSSSSLPLVMVDLGNVHDVLHKMDSYIENHLVQKPVLGFADKQFNGFGVNPVPANDNCVVWQATDTHKNSADVKIVWTVTSLVNKMIETENYYNIIIATKDQGFMSLKTLTEHETGGKSCIKFVNNFDMLCAIIN